MPDSPFKFPHSYRLASKQDIASVFADACKIAHRLLLVLYKPNQRSHARLGIVIGKRHIKQAVHRNRLRRLVRESFRHDKERLKGLDIIVLVRSECMPATRAAIRRKKGLQETLPPGGTKRNQIKMVGREDIDKLWLQLTDTYKPVC